MAFPHLASTHRVRQKSLPEHELADASSRQATATVTVKMQVGAVASALFSAGKP
jgi:hypothetical protein